jgi:hypothetical protein
MRFCAISFRIERSLQRKEAVGPGVFKVFAVFLLDQTFDLFISQPFCTDIGGLMHYLG